MAFRSRRRHLVARLIGAMLLIPGVLQVPLPQADFHTIRHHHGAGEVCPRHDHLLRWHPKAGEGDAVAVLHWHWLLPRSLDPSALDLEGRKVPALHAHEGDAAQVDQQPSGRLTLAREDRGRDGGRQDLAVALDLHLADCVWNGLADQPPRHHVSRTIGDLDGDSAATARSRLARWNC